MNSNKGFGLVGLLIGVLIIALLGGGVFYGYKGGLFGGGTASSTITGPIDAAKKAKDLLEKNNQAVVQEVSTPSPSDWKTYRNEEYGFEFKYPNAVTITPRSGPGGTSYFPFSNKILELSGNKLSLYVGVPKNQYFVYATTTGKFLLKGTSEFLSCENSNGTSVAVMPGSSIPVVRGGFGDGRDPGESFYVFKGTKGALAVIVQNQSCDTVSLDGSPYDPKEIESCNNEVKAGDKVKVGILETLKLINGSPQSFYCLINPPDAGIEVRLEFSLLPLPPLSFGFS